MFSATCILYSTSVTAMVASGFHEVRWTLLFIICLTQLMTQSRVVARVGTVTLALWLTSTIIVATLLQLAHWLTSRAQRGSCPQIILCSPLFGFFWRVCDYAEIYPETSQNEILPSFRYAISSHKVDVETICQCRQNTFIQPSNEILAKTIHCQFAF